MSSEKRIVAGRYEINRELIRCRFTTLYNGFDRQKGSPVTVRVLNDKTLMGDPDMMHDAALQMQLEADTLKSTSCPGIPAFIDFVEDENGPCIIFEDFFGTTLYSMLINSELKKTDKSFKWFISQLLHLVESLHEKSPQVICGGIHPQSLLITPEGNIKLVEFSFMTAGAGVRAGSSFRTLGPPRYSSPQQKQGNPPCPADDIYSIGASIYFMCTGTEPERSLDRLISGKKEDLSRLSPTLSPGFASQLEKALEPDSNARYQDIGSFTRDFQGQIFLDTPPAEETRKPPAGAPGKPEEPAVKKNLTFKEILTTKMTVGEIFEKVLPHPAKEPVRAAPDVSTADSDFLARYPFIDLKTARIDRAVARLIPERISRAIEGIVIEKNEYDEITLAVKDPTMTTIYDHISYISKGQLKPVIFRAEPELIDSAIEYAYDNRQGGEKVMWFEFIEKKRFSGMDLEVKQDQSQLEMFQREAIEGPVIELANRIIKEAISAGASDIHLETYEKSTLLRYRIDGVLHSMNQFEPEIAKTIVKRLKILAKADISQERDTQGGRISVAIGGKEFDLRVSIVPVAHGENIVMRILNKGAFNFSLKDLGFTQDTMDQYMHLLTRPYGMILVSGPTGSGKSTTLYASLTEIIRPDRKILTVEDPIEYEISAISQVQVNLAPREQEKKVTFAKVLREFLRQDPDVILVGEIRDQETAEISVQAALTGHLLLSTIHTNDSVGIITRLKDMHIAPYLVGSVLVGGIAQRLVRKICDTCKYQITPSDVDKKIFEGYGINLTSLYQGRGCDLCHNYGYRGRVGVYEILKVTPEMSELISSGAGAGEIKKMAQEHGMQPLLHDALVKAATGVISRSEVDRVTVG